MAKAFDRLNTDSDAAFAIYLALVATTEPPAPSAEALAEPAVVNPDSDLLLVHFASRSDRHADKIDQSAAKRSHDAESVDRVLSQDWGRWGLRRGPLVSFSPTSGLHRTPR